MSNKVEAALLCDGFQTYEPENWLRLINEFAAGFGVSFERTNHERFPNYINLQGNGMTLEITCASQMIENSVFVNSLSSEVTRLNFPECYNAVSSHTSYVYFSITKGSAAPEGLVVENEVNEVGEFSEEAYDFAISLLRMALCMQIARSLPLAVYWEQCDRLFDCKEFLKLAIDQKNNALLIHPVYYHDPSMEQEEVIGVRSYGARNLIGHEIDFLPCDIPPEELYDLALHYITVTREVGYVLPHGEIFGRDESEYFQILHEEDESTGETLVRLALVYSERYNIDNRVSEEISGDPEAIAEEQPQEPVVETDDVPIETACEVAEFEQDANAALEEVSESVEEQPVAAELVEMPEDNQELAPDVVTLADAAADEEVQEEEMSQMTETVDDPSVVNAETPTAQTPSVDPTEQPNSEPVTPMEDLEEENEFSEPEIDPEDPAERALQEKIEEMNRSDEGDGYGEEDYDIDEEITAFERALEERSSRVREKVDVAHLRTLAGADIAPAALLDDEDKDAGSKKPKRHLGGLFSRRQKKKQA
ncbi:MAG: hypothetical protein AAF412_09435 [Pseudomonadota bacterium]